jgi:hypothetical protein
MLIFAVCSVGQPKEDRLEHNVRQEAGKNYSEDSQHMYKDQCTVIMVVGECRTRFSLYLRISQK